MTHSIRVLVVRPSKSSFIENDIKMLERHFEVRTVDIFEKGRSFRNSVKVFVRLFKGVVWSDVTYSWFAEIYALWAVRLSRLLSKKSIVVIGGYDVACIPEIGYGKLIDPHEASQVRYTINHADRVLTVSDGLKQDAIKNAGARGDNIQTLPTGYDPERFSPLGHKEPIVLTAAFCDDPKRIKIKGIDVFIEVARSMPYARFEVIGISDQMRVEFASPSPENLKLTPPLLQDEMIERFQRAKVYCQLSIREGLPNALCEAMLCECVPVVSDVGAMPDVVGQTGFVVQRNDLDAIMEVVRQALVSDTGTDARARVKYIYSMARREKALVSIINGLVKRGE